MTFQSVCHANHWDVKGPHPRHSDGGTSCIFPSLSKDYRVIQWMRKICRQIPERKYLPALNADVDTEATKEGEVSLLSALPSELPVRQRCRFYCNF